VLASYDLVSVLITLVTFGQCFDHCRAIIASVLVERT
jgi:hypothetical protein